MPPEVATFDELVQTLELDSPPGRDMLRQQLQRKSENKQATGTNVAQQQRGRQGALNAFGGRLGVPARPRVSTHIRVRGDPRHEHV